MGAARVETLDVAALTLGENVPSARFRVRQFVPALAERGIVVHEHYPAPLEITLSKHPFRRRVQLAAALAERVRRRLPAMAASYQADATWLSKQAVVGIPSLEPLLKKPLVLDVDDAVWLAAPAGRLAAITAARAASAIVAGNRFLAEWYGQFNESVHVVPTSVDTSRFFPADPREGAFVVGWTGSATTLPFLELAEQGIAAFLDARRDARLLIVCDVPPTLARVPRERVDYVPWSPDVEAAAVRRMSVGLMPLPDTELARGKCSFKMLQYMASGLPVAVSPLGSNAEILAMGDVGFACDGPDAWEDALDRCFVDRDLAQRMGAAGRSLVEREFSVAASAEKLARIFRSLRS